LDKADVLKSPGASVDGHKVYVLLAPTVAGFNQSVTFKVTAALVDATKSTEAILIMYGITRGGCWSRGWRLFFPFLQIEKTILQIEN
jgi:hypothetical protein